MARNAANRDAPGALCLVEVKATDDLQEPSGASAAQGAAGERRASPLVLKRTIHPPMSLRTRD